MILLLFVWILYYYCCCVYDVAFIVMYVYGILVIVMHIILLLLLWIWYYCNCYVYNSVIIVMYMLLLLLLCIWSCCYCYVYDIVVIIVTRLIIPHINSSVEAALNDFSISIWYVHHAGWAGCDHSLCRLCVGLTSLSPQIPLSFFKRPQRSRAPVSPDVTQHTVSSSALKSSPHVPFPSRCRSVCGPDPSSWDTDTPSVEPMRSTGEAPPGSDRRNRHRERERDVNS